MKVIVILVLLTLWACESADRTQVASVVNQQNEQNFILAPTPAPTPSPILIPLQSAQKVARIESSPTPQPTPELKLTIAPSEANLPSGSQIQLVVWKQQGEQRVRIFQPTWVVRDPEVALIQPNGTLKARKAGNTSIEAIADNLQVTMILSVTPGPLAQITIEPQQEVRLAIRETQVFEATGVDMAGNPLENVEVTWQVSDDSIGSINAQGIFTAGIQRGSVRIIATHAKVTAQKSIIIE